jgi:hypothetical protein
MVPGNEPTPEPARILAPPVGVPTAGPTDEGRRAWVWTVEFLHTRHSTRHHQRLIVYCDLDSLWTAGQAMARSHGTRYFEQRLGKENPIRYLSDYVILSVTCDGEFDQRTGTITIRNLSDAENRVTVEMRPRA